MSEQLTDDLVKRLRGETEWTNQKPYFHAHTKCLEAADRIEALTAEIEKLRKALEEAPTIGLRESGEAFKSRQDNWLKTKAFPALGEQP